WSAKDAQDVLVNAIRWVQRVHESEELGAVGDPGDLGEPELKLRSEDLGKHFELLIMSAVRHPVLKALVWVIDFVFKRVRVEAFISKSGDDHVVFRADVYRGKKRIVSCDARRSYGDNPELSEMAKEVVSEAIVKSPRRTKVSTRNKYAFLHLTEALSL